MNAASKPLVVITGASSGIGLATAKLLSERGHALLLLARGLFGLIADYTIARSGRGVARDLRMQLMDKYLHLPGVHGRLQPRAHPPHGHAEGDARRHSAVDAQHLLPAQPYAACPPGHYRGPLRCIRERLDEQSCCGGLLRATGTLAERGQRQWSSASRSSHSLTPAARPLTDSLQVLDASWVPYRIVDVRAGVWRMASTPPVFLDRSTHD